MYRIATKRCLDALRDAKRRPPPVPPVLPASTFRLEASEAIRLAFVAALQRLVPRQGAALLLYDVNAMAASTSTAT